MVLSIRLLFNFSSTNHHSSHKIVTSKDQLILRIKGAVFSHGLVNIKLLLTRAQSVQMLLRISVKSLKRQCVARWERICWEALEFEKPRVLSRELQIQGVARRNLPCGNTI